MSRNYLLPVVMIVMMIVTTGCADKKEIIDLNKVLDIMLDDFNIYVPTMYMNNEIMRSASVFGKDIQKLDVPVNTIMEPKLYDLYLRELREGPI